MPGFFEKVVSRLDRLDADSLRRQYERLASDTRFLEALVRTMHEGVLALGARGELKWSNAAAERLAGFSFERMRGKPASLVLPGFGDGAPARGAAVREAEIEYPERRTLSIETAPLETGGESGTLVLLRDITAERAREADALETGRADAVRELAAGVAHEIGNPVNALAIRLQLMERDLRRKDAAGEQCDAGALLGDVRTAREELSRIDTMIRDFLAALRPVKPVLEPGTLADPLADTLSAMKSQIESRSIRVSVDLPAALPKVLLDRGMMRQVFFNIVKNALEAMKDGSVLEIALKSGDQNVEAVFRDHGAGMSPGDLARIFEPHRTTKRDGNGLGLMICRRIVRAHGGEISAESAEGEGTAFTVSVPRIEKRVRMLPAQPVDDCK